MERNRKCILCETVHASKQVLNKNVWIPTWLILFIYYKKLRIPSQWRVFDKKDVTKKQNRNVFCISHNREKKTIMIKVLEQDIDIYIYICKYAIYAYLQVYLGF